MYKVKLLILCAAIITSPLTTVTVSNFDFFSRLFNNIVNYTQSLFVCSHQNTVIKNASRPSCCEDGYSGDTYCKKCNLILSKGQVIPASGHGISVIEGFQYPSCTEDGYTGDRICTVCKEVIEVGSSIPATGHQSTVKIFESAASCSCEGYTGDCICSSCGACIKKGQVIPKTAHLNTEIIGYKKATCTTDGYTGDTYCKDCCTIIDYGETISKTGHLQTTIRNQINATTDSNGYSGDKYCLVCNALICKGSVTYFWEELERHIFDFLYNLCGNAKGAAGFMGNLYYESELKTNNLQNTFNKILSMTDDEYTSVVDDGTYSSFINDGAGYGLAQWTYGARKEGLLNTAKKKNQSISSLDVQLEFIKYELLHDKINVLNYLKNAESIREASDYVLKYYEGPADQSETVKIKRAAKGQEYFDKYAQNP